MCERGEAPFSGVVCWNNEITYHKKYFILRGQSEFWLLKLSKTIFQKHLVGYLQTMSKVKTSCLDVSNENRKWKWTREERKKDKEHLYSNNLFGFLDYFFRSYNVTLNTKNLFIFYFSDKFQFELLNHFFGFYIRN